MTWFRIKGREHKKQDNILTHNTNFSGRCVFVSWIYKTILHLTTVYIISNLFDTPMKPTPATRTATARGRSERHSAYKPIDSCSYTAQHPAAVWSWYARAQSCSRTKSGLYSGQYPGGRTKVYRFGT